MLILNVYNTGCNVKFITKNPKSPTQKLSRQSLESGGTVIWGDRAFSSLKEMMDKYYDLKKMRQTMFRNIVNSIYEFKNKDKLI